MNEKELLEALRKSGRTELTLKDGTTISASEIINIDTPKLSKQQIRGNGVSIDRKLLSIVDAMEYLKKIGVSLPDPESISKTKPMRRGLSRHVYNYLFHPFTLSPCFVLFQIYNRWHLNVGKEFVEAMWQFVHGRPITIYGCNGRLECVTIDDLDRELQCDLFYPNSVLNVRIVSLSKDDSVSNELYIKQLSNLVKISQEDVWEG